MIKRIYEGQCLTRQEIAVLYGGNNRAFLPRMNGGDVVAGCFDPEMNPRVPYEILVHNAPNAIANAERFLDQTSASGIAGGNASVNERGARAGDDDSTSGRPIGTLPDGRVSARSAVPVFLRRAPNVWEYVGRYRAVGYTEDPDQVSNRIYEIRPRVYERHAKAYGQVRGIIFLEAED